jgi:predicted amidohydrolase YtcJ
VGVSVEPNQRIKPYEGLQAMTINVAAQYDESESKGSLSPANELTLLYG